jgi:GntR family transcriptional regulator/MocR family aminotransferase
MFPWQSRLRFERTSEKPIYLQIANSIIEEIHVGRLLPGQKLPGARKLGNLLGLNRKTIVSALYELNSQGWIESYQHKGTFISKSLPKVEYEPLRGKELSNKAKTYTPYVNQLPFLESLYLDDTGKILIDDGVPDVRLAPLKLLFSYQRSILSKKIFSDLLKYHHVEGDIGLRTTLTSYLHDTRGIITTPDNVFLTRGSQMGIYLVLASLIKKGDTCVTSFPGYQIVDTMIIKLGGQIEHIPVDREGLVTSAVEELCKKKKIKLLYTTPHHHYPTTVTFSSARRIELLQLSLKYDFFILEDDYDYDFQYDYNPILPLASLSKNHQVIYIGSFSKCLSPLVRIGFFIAPIEIMEAANKLRRIIDRQGDPLLERAMSEFIKNGDLQRHLKKAVKVYRNRRDYFCALLSEGFEDYLTFRRPDGGMSIWIVFRKAILAPVLLERIASNGYLLDTDKVYAKKNNSIRVGFASLNEKEMEQFITILKKTLAQMPIS